MKFEPKSGGRFNLPARSVTYQFKADKAEAARHLEISMKSAISRFLQDRSGATTVEYALMVSLLGVIALTALTKLGTTLSNKYATMANSVS